MDLRPLRRHRDYRLLYAAQFVSLLGGMVTYVALPWQMYRLSGSSLAVGFLGLAELLPLLVTAFVGGALADAVDRRRMMIFTEVGLTGGCGLLMLNAALERPSVRRASLRPGGARLRSPLAPLRRLRRPALPPRGGDPGRSPPPEPLRLAGREATGQCLPPSRRLGPTSR